jgi:hypothetical protein
MQIGVHTHPRLLNKINYKSINRVSQVFQLHEIKRSQMIFLFFDFFNENGEMN